MKAAHRALRYALPTLLALALGMIAGACASGLIEEHAIRAASGAELPGIAQQLEARTRTHPDDGTALARLALAELRLGRTEAARTHALAAIRAEPYVGAHHFVLGEVYEASERPTRALAAYGQVVELEPDRLPAYLRYARLQAALGRREAALETLDEALRREPLHFGAALMRADLLLRNGDTAEASEAIERARRVRPWDPEGLQLHARILRTRGLVDAAVALIEEARRRAPQERTLLATQAELERDREDWTAALATLDALARLGPLRPEERLLRADVLMGLGRTREAEALLEALVRETPDFAPGRARRAELLVRAGRFREALRETQQATALAPHLAEALYWEAVAHYQLGEPALGDAALAAAGERAPHRTAISLLQALRLLSAYRLDAAAPLLDAVLDAQPTLNPALLVHAERMVLRGELAVAREVLARISPEFEPPQVRFAGVRIAYIERRWSDVVAGAEPLLEHPLLGWRATYLLAAAQLHQDRPAEALTLLRPHLGGDARRVEFHHLAGYVYLLQGDRVAAQRTFRAGLALAPRNPLMIEGLSRMAMDAKDWAQAQELLRQGLEAPGGLRALFLDRLVRIGRERGESGPGSLRTFLEASDPARAGGSASPASSVLFGAFFPDYDLPSPVVPPTSPETARASAGSRPRATKPAR